MGLTSPSSTLAGMGVPTPPCPTRALFLLAAASLTALLALSRTWSLSFSSRRIGRGGGFTKPCSSLKRVSAVRAGTTAGFYSKPPVLVTREKGKNDKLRKRLEDRGVKVLEVPCIQAKELDGAKQLPELLKGEWSWIVVTSPEGAKILSRSWDESGKPEVRVAAVGAATAKIIEKAGISNVFIPSKAHAKALGDELPPPNSDEKTSNKILYPVSQLAKDEVEVLLGRKGYDVHRIDSYTTLPADWSDDDAKVVASARVVTFGSPSAVRVWADRASVDSPIAVCIGGTSARACKEAGFAHIVYPEKPGVDTWAEEVLGVLENMETMGSTSVE
mmetsp:Transcript_32436/g.45206  ORF Transcript_32436/g.45206 Transcript_32436/m.45206 type:complete len:331 (+) Transcript_32436:1-993(+)